MPGLELQPFSDDHLDAAATLLAERHERHRALEPLLPPVDDFRAQIESDWRTEGASGAVALDAGEVVGYLLARPLGFSGERVAWVGLAGQAARKPDHVRDLYAAAAGPWLEAGLTKHYAFAPAIDDMVEPWHRLCFGKSAALAARETAPEPAGQDDVTVRLSTPDDLHAAASFDLLLKQHLASSPSFGGVPVPELEELVEEWRTTWDEPEFTHFVAERDGRIVGHALLYRRPQGDLRVPAGSIDLANAATEPDVRGSGVGLALTAHVLRWAHENGYPIMITDWRMTNLVASRFWPQRGFRETFLRLYRSIP